MVGGGADFLVGAQPQGAGLAELRSGKAAAQRGHIIVQQKQRRGAQFLQRDRVVRAEAAGRPPALLRALRLPGSAAGVRRQKGRHAFLCNGRARYRPLPAGGAGRCRGLNTGVSCAELALLSQKGPHRHSRWFLLCACKAFLPAAP